MFLMDVNFFNYDVSCLHSKIQNLPGIEPRLFNQDTITRPNLDTCICEIFFVSSNLLLSNFSLNLKYYYINYISENASYEYFLS